MAALGRESKDPPPGEGGLYQLVRGRSSSWYEYYNTHVRVHWPSSSLGSSAKFGLPVVPHLQ